MDWIHRFFGKDNKMTLTGGFYELSTNVFYKRLAVETCIDLIANTLSRCEFQTFENGKESRGENYYLLNVQPNQNQNATEFLQSLISHLVHNNECLVIMENNQLYVADSFNKKSFALKENYYDGVTIEDLTFKKTFKESEVLHFKLNDKNIMNVIDGLWNDYGKLLASAINYYKRKNNKRVLIKGDFLRSQDEKTQAAINEMFETQLKNWFDPNKEGSAFQMQTGYELEDLSDGTTSKSQNSTSRDVNELVNDIINYVSMAFHIPRGILKGDVADIEKQIDSFIMFCIKPMAKLIADEFNRKMYTKEEYLKRTYLKVETNEIKVVDLNQFANAADKLFAIGGFTINDVLKRLGQEPINEEWANRRHVTKNYQEANTLEGGE